MELHSRRCDDGAGDIPDLLAVSCMARDRRRQAEETFVKLWKLENEDQANLT